MPDILWLNLLGGIIAGCVALALGGLPLLLSQGAHLRRLDRDLTSEVKRRASAAGVAARTDRSGLQEWAAEQVAGRPVPSGPRLIGKRVL